MLTLIKDKRVISKLPLIVLAIMLAAFGFYIASSQEANADAKNSGLYCSIKAPDGADVGDKGKFQIKLTGKGAKVELVVDFGEDIQYEEGDFFAAPEEGWDPEKEYELEHFETGKYLLTAEDFDGTLIIDGAGVFKEDGLNVVSISGTYYGPEGKMEISDAKETIVGNGPQEEPEDVDEQAGPDEDSTEPSQTQEENNNENSTDADSDKNDKSDGDKNIKEETTTEETTTDNGASSSGASAGQKPEE